MKLVLLRWLTALAGIPIFIFFLIKGGLAWFLFLAVLVTLSGLELSSLLTKLGYKNTWPWVVGGGLYLLTIAYISVGDGSGRFSAPVVYALPLMLLLTIEIATTRKPLQRTAAICLSSMYIGLYAHLFLTRAAGIPLVLMAVLGTWFTDSMAFFIGSRFGRTPLVPLISPNKSVEGALAGVAGALIASTIIAHVAGWPLWQGLGFGLGTALAAQIGDLVESAMKREAEVKDSGHLLPGHGGVLDRFDSLIFAGPAVYYLWLLIM